MESATASPPATTSNSSPSKFSKKPFLLLEILISILIVSLCLIPLIQGPIFTYREEMLLLEEMERERLSEWSFSEAKETLLNREIPWDRLPSKGETSLPIFLSPKQLEIPGTKQRKIERSFTLHCTGEKEGEKGEIYRIFKVDILFDPPLKNKNGKKRRKDKHSYRLMVQKVKEGQLPD